MWFSVVYSFIDNDTRHHSGQNVVDSRGAAEWVRKKFWPLWWRIVVDKTIYHAKPHSIYFLPQYQRNEIFVLTTFADSLDMQKQFEKRLGKRVVTRTRCWYEYIPRKTTFRFIFYHNINDKENFFFSERELKRHCVTHWRKQRGRDSYLPRQISQSDCEITCDCGKK